MNLTEDQVLTIVGIGSAFLVLFFFVRLIKKQQNSQIMPPPSHHHAKSQKASLEKTEKPQKVIPEKKMEDVGIASKESLPSSAENPFPWYQRLRMGLNQTHNQIIRNLDEFFLSKKEKNSREETLEYLFELLIQADVGVSTSELLVERVKNRLEKGDFENVEKFKGVLKEEILLVLNTMFENKQGTIENPKHTPHVVLMVGVNGAGKTTTTGKLAFKAHLNQKSVIIGAADTFRAAAVEQLAVWAERSHAELIRLKEGVDPASVAFEATKKAAEQRAELCLIDTAGRLQTRHDLMQELSKIARVTGKDVVDAPHEVLLVLDATTGQNALQQAKLFKEAVAITGIILTKLDGTAKGGIAIAIANELGLPIRYVGVGESVEDLEIFDPNEFVDALFHN
jgi:fused signal recognition particle receptor